MFVNPFPFGIFIGVISTITVEIIAIIIAASRINKGDKK